MPKLIEVLTLEGLPVRITVEKGDVLLIKATGGQVKTGPGVLQLIGAFVPAIMQENGEVITPAGAPNTILCLAHAVGLAQFEVYGGDPWYKRQVSELQIIVR